MPRPPLRPCGTYSAYCRHIARFERPCWPCSEARRAYMEAYHGAWRQLAEEFPARYEELWEQARGSRDRGATAMMTLAREQPARFAAIRDATGVSAGG